MYTEIVS